MAKAKTGAFPEEVRDLLMQRADGRCERCGTPMSSFQIHHRRPRGMGGSRLPDTGGASNGLVLHPHCHLWIETHRKAAASLGFLVGQGRQTESAEVRMSDGWFLLTADGQRMPYSPDA
jgi:hypothetical protein